MAMSLQSFNSVSGLDQVLQRNGKKNHNFDVIMTSFHGGGLSDLQICET